MLYILALLLTKCRKSYTCTSAIITTVVLYIYRGYWHGQVCVRTRQHKTAGDWVRFTEEVYTLSCIRHHNIQLFMGACVIPQLDQPFVLVMR